MIRKFLEKSFGPLNIITMSLLVILFAYPVYYIIIYSLSTPNLVGEGLLIRPLGLTLISFRATIEATNVIQAFGVSLLRSTMGPVFTCFICMLTAYVFSRRDLIARKFLLRMFTFAMYFNVGLIPTYLLIKNLGMTNSFLVYIVPHMLNIFNVIVMRTYIESLPASLEEAAFIDGANDVQIFIKIIIPLCKPVIAAILLFACVEQWNTYYDTMMYNAQSPKLFTMQYILVNLVNSYSSIEMFTSSRVSFSAVTGPSVKMAVTVLTIIPISFVYPFLQKYFIKGMILGAVKG